MIILNGKKLANKILNKLKKEVKKMPVLPTGRPPIKLVVVLVGKNPASLNFIKQKQKAAEKIGIDFKLYKFNLKINTQNFLREISKIIKDKSVTGIVIQLPLPTHIDLQKVLNLLPKNMDVDALSVDNYFVEPPIVSGIIKLLEEYKIGMKGKKIVIVGQGKLVGKPLAKTLKQAGLNLKTYDIRTKNLGNKTLEADILISATGQPHLIKES